MEQFQLTEAKKPLDQTRPIEQAERAEQKEPTDTIVNGRFAAFKGGVLKVHVPDDRTGVVTQQQWNLDDDVKVVSHRRAGATQSAARDAFKRWAPGGLIAVSLSRGKVVSIELGTDRAWLPKPGQSRQPTLKIEADHNVETKPATDWGRFVSFENGTLKLETNSGDLIECMILRRTKTTVWNDLAEKFEPTDTFKALEQVRVGTVIVVQGATPSDTLRIGSLLVSTSYPQ